MISLFSLSIIAGLLWLLLEAGAKAASPAPSMHRTSGNGWVLIIVGAVGILFVSYLP